MAPKTNETYSNRRRLTSVEWIDGAGRLCCAQFWNFCEAARFAAQVAILVNIQPF